MKTSLLVLFTCLFFPASGQFGWTKYEALKNLKDGQTLVVKSGIESYDRLMEDAFKKYWTVNNYKLIDLEQAKGQAPHPNTFYITTVEVTAYYGTVNYNVFKLLLTNQLQFDKRGKVDYQHKKMNFYATAQFEKMLSDEKQFVHLYLQAELIKGVQLINNHCSFVLEDKPDKFMDVKEYLKIKSAKNRNHVHQNRHCLQRLPPNFFSGRAGLVVAFQMKKN